MKCVYLFTGIIILLLQGSSGSGTDGKSTRLANITMDVIEVMGIIDKLGWNSSQFEEIIRNNKLDIPDYSDEDVIEEEHEHKSTGVKVAKFKWDYVKEHLVLIVFVIVIALFKLIYHHTRYTRKILPESCCLILLGILLGFLFIGDSTHASIKFLEFNSKTFFFYLLPPIILESAYSLKDRAFIENFGTIVLYAVVGTVLNILLIGGSLISLKALGWLGGINLTVLDIIVFASLIAAVDPVAVLAVFQDVGVNKMLYFMVFGESLLNDAVTIVCYNLAIEFQELPEFTIFDCFMGFLAFLCVSLGGLLIGLVCGALTSICTKYTNDVRVAEPVFVFGFAYLSYIGAELFHFSGIIGLIACGLFQGHYACCNISYKSFSTVMYFTKVMSSVSESLIFIILGVMLVNEQEWFWGDWHPIFSVAALLICIIVRPLVTFSLTYVVNQFTGGVRHISHEEQFIMSYGGLRGAVSFSLAFMISSDPEVKNTILAATYMVILFTVFVQGSTIKFLVSTLKIGLDGKEDNLRLFVEFNKGMIVHLSQGIEDLCGYKNLNWINRSSKFSKMFLRPILEKNYNEKSKTQGKLVELDRACTMREAMINSPSQSSFKRQQTIDEMTESGVFPLDFLEDSISHGSSHAHAHTTPHTPTGHPPVHPHGHTFGPSHGHPGTNTHGHPHGQTPSNTDPTVTAELEKRTAELTKDITSIRQLMNNPYEDCYLDRNLTHEEEKEKKRVEHVRHLQSTAKAISGVKKKKSLGFGKKRSIRTNATQQGLIHSAIATLGVHSAAEHEHPSTSSARVSVEDEEEGLNMKSMDMEEHPLMTIREGDETNF